LPIQSNVKLKIYNAVGQLVETILDKQMDAGYHEFIFNAAPYPSGIYFYLLESEKINSVKKMILLK
jgi:flagellar hook assembly protein FlgD